MGSDGVQAAEVACSISAGDIPDLVNVLARLGAVRAGKLSPALIDRAAWWLLRLHSRRRRLWRRLRRILERRLWDALPEPDFLGEHTPRLRGRIWVIGWSRAEGESTWHLWVR